MEIGVDDSGAVYNLDRSRMTESYSASSLWGQPGAERLQRPAGKVPPDITMIYLQLAAARGPARGANWRSRSRWARPTDYDKASAIELYLRTRYGYSLQMASYAAAGPAGVLPVRAQGRTLRVLRLGHGGDAAHAGNPGADRERLPRRRIQRPDRQLHRARTRRALLGGGLHSGIRLGELRSDAGGSAAGDRQHAPLPALPGCGARVLARVGDQLRLPAPAHAHHHGHGARTHRRRPDTHLAPPPLSRPAGSRRAACIAMPSAGRAPGPWARCWR